MLDSGTKNNMLDKIFENVIEKNNQKKMQGSNDRDTVLYKILEGAIEKNNQKKIDKDGMLDKILEEVIEVNDDKNILNLYVKYMTYWGNELT